MIKLTVLGKNLVLFRNAEGKPAALLDRCAHRFTPLSLGKLSDSKRVTCPYHGWSFDSEGNGYVPGETEKSCRIPKFDILESHGYLWIGNISAVGNLPKPPNDSDWQFSGTLNFEFKAPLHVVLDNFSEDEHFPYVHNVFGWDEKGAKDVVFNHRAVDNHIEVEYLGPQRHFPLMEFYMFPKNSLFKNHWKMEFQPLRFTFVSQMVKKTGEIISPAIVQTEIYFVPKNENETSMHIFLFTHYRNKTLAPILKLTMPFFKKLIGDDILKDVHFCEKIATIPLGTTGMVLRDYDQPIKKSRLLMDKIYFGNQNN